MADQHDLDRFIDAQAGTYETALQEVRSSAKRSHWMWFIFPQIAGLGRSAMAQRYAIADRAEAEAYLSHPVLGERLREITRTLQALPNADPERVFGGIDAVKLRSSLTSSLAPTRIRMAFSNRHSTAGSTANGMTRPSNGSDRNT